MLGRRVGRDGGGDAQQRQPSRGTESLVARSCKVGKVICLLLRSCCRCWAVVGGGDSLPAPTLKKHFALLGSRGKERRWQQLLAEQQPQRTHQKTPSPETNPASPSGSYKAQPIPELSCEVYKKVTGACENVRLREGKWLTKGHRARKQHQDVTFS